MTWLKTSTAVRQSRPVAPALRWGRRLGVVALGFGVVVAGQGVGSAARAHAVVPPSRATVVASLPPVTAVVTPTTAPPVETTTAVPAPSAPVVPPATTLPPALPRPVPAPTVAVPTVAVPTTLDACTVALAYLDGHAAPGFAHFCRPGSLTGDAGFTCVPGSAYSCPDGTAEIIISDPTCAASYENEASNSHWDFSQAGTVGPGAVQDGRSWDPFGSCPTS